MMPGGSPRASLVPLNMRGIPYADQVPRRQEFEREHPEVRITFLSTVWQGVIPQPDGEIVVTRYELSDLLDAMEEHFTPP